MKYMLFDEGEVYANDRRMYNVGIRALAKFAEPYAPFEFANEFIGYSLGQLAGLPVVPGLLSRREDEDCYCSFNFNSFAPEQLPPADVKKLVKGDERLATGIVLFDSWLVHEDRHSANLAFNEATGEVFLFDHGEAFLKGTNPMKRLQNYEFDPALGSSCLVKHLPGDLPFFRDWWYSILDIPENAIRGVLSHSVSYGMRHEWIDCGTDYLLKRRTRLATLFLNNSHLFTGPLPDRQKTLFPRVLKPANLCRYVDDYDAAQREALDWVGRDKDE